mmetsp:Transcript_54625/g.111530  ORF Transcript_54625/g.111530 Transcript_54625/m.111530 type:complete len:455 (+) Transcript_54625:165-1529(+)|eukprot:CAMPEP_0181300254 /NCGR_PEP_ID=MMETSP1101-20121128/6791_1 /TAXON_ID=46948 /ORGANISM="Rhodomonas abbreviata, Strain Caron Lab Isolate" /LENGTH=454 /DNA_ID=CAMNT_0023405477 /DNA_START=158 /DNA_END=1522 /DNA_ORIENTATION=+
MSPRKGNSVLPAHHSKSFLESVLWSKKVELNHHRHDAMNNWLRLLYSQDRAVVAGALRSIVYATDGKDQYALQGLVRVFKHPKLSEWNRTAIADIIESKFACPEALQLVIRCLDTYVGTLRDASCRIIANTISVENGAEPIRLIATHLESMVMTTRKVALLLLCDLCDRHSALNGTVLSAVARYMEHPVDYVRQTAVESLVMLSERSDKADVIREITKRLEHHRSDVREAAHQTILALTGKSSGESKTWIASVSCCLDSENPAIRAAGAQTLQGLNLQDKRAIELSPSLATPGRQVSSPRQHATPLSGCSEIPPSSRMTIAYVGDRLESEDTEVRKEAITTLRLMSDSGLHHRADLVRAAARRLDHDEVAVRESAVEALSLLVGDQDRESVDIVMEWLNAPSSVTRTTALTAIGRIASKGDKVVLQALSNRLQDDDYRVVREALLVIEKLARFE